MIELPFMGLAIWTGWRYFRQFALDFPRDYEQVCAVAALSCVGLSNHEAFKLISRLFIRTLREYGYGKTDDGRWLQRELLVLRVCRPSPDKQCGVCDKVGQHLDKRFERLCGRHYMYVRQRIKWGWANPYDGIEETALLKQSRKLVRCAHCGEWKSERIKRLNNRCHSFCNHACYHSYRRGERKAA